MRRLFGTDRLAEFVPQAIHLHGQLDLLAQRFQHSLLHLIASDGVVGAGAFLHFFERGTDVIAVAFAGLEDQLAVHGAPTVSTSHKACEKEHVVLGRRSAHVPLKQLLRLFKCFRWYNGLVCPLYHHPFAIGHDDGYLKFVAADSVFPLDEATGI